MEKHSRRAFFRTTGLGLAAGAFTPYVKAVESSGTASLHASVPFNPELGLASYTTREFSLDETIKMAQRVNLKHLVLKSMHLPLTATEAECRSAADKIKAAGIDFYGAGVIYMKTKEEVDQAFNYARACGIRIIVGAPAYELLPYTEEMVKKHDLRVAIHNHGPGDNLYPTVPGIYDKIKNLDKRIGICMDIGHIVRLNHDPAEELNQCFDRIIDMHMKDEDKRAPEGEPIEIGRGIIDIPGFLKMLVKLRYQGYVTFEYEKDARDPLPGLAESVGYVRGVFASLQS